MKLKSIVIHNFLSYKHAELDFASLAPCTLVLGENLTDTSTQGNGAGKSGLMEAIIWCLFDTTARGLSKNDIINRNDPRNTAEVILSLSCGDDDYTITRRRAIDTKVIIVKNGKTHHFTTLSSAQNYIEEKITKMGFQAFINSVVFAETEASFITASPAQRTSILRSIFSLDGVVAAKARCSEDKSRARNKITEFDIRITSHQDTLKRLDINYLLEQSAQWTEAQALKMKKLTQQMRELKLENIEELTPMEPPAPVDESRLAQYSGQLAEANAVLNEVKMKISNVTTLKTKSEHDLKQFLAIGPTCPKCLSGITSKHTKTVQKEMEQEIQKYEAELKELRYEQTKQELNAQQARALHTQELEAIRKHQNKHKQYNEYLVQKAKVDANRANALNVYKMKMFDIERRIKEVEDAENPYTASLESVKTERAQVVALIEQMTKDRNTMANLLVTIDFWYPAFKKIEIMSMNNIINLLQSRAREYLMNLSDNTLSVRVVLEENDTLATISFDLLNRDKVCPYKSLSGSERQKVKLAIFWAMSDIVNARTGSRCEFALYDEPLHGAVDTIGTELIIEAIKSQENERQVLLISHENDVKSSFESTLMIRRTEEGSTIYAE